MFRKRARFVTAREGEGLWQVGRFSFPRAESASRGPADFCTGEVFDRRVSAKGNGPARASSYRLPVPDAWRET